MAAENTTAEVGHSNAGHGHHELPWGELLIPQFFNFTLFLCVLVYLVRKPVAEYFKTQSKNFDERKKSAEVYKIDADKKNFEVRSRLRELEETSAQSLSTAQKDAAAMKEKMISEAKAQSNKAEADAHEMVKYELQRAVSMLKTDLVKQAARYAEENLNKQMNEATHAKLGDAFVARVQGQR